MCCVCVFTHDAAHVEPSQMDADSVTYCHCRVSIPKLYMKFSHWDYVLGELIWGDALSFVVSNVHVLCIWRQVAWFPKSVKSVRMRHLRHNIIYCHGFLFILALI
jgi:hypothetical protein